MRDRRFPTHGWLGLLLIAIIWPVSWLHVHALGEVSFFPLWLGYILAADGLVLMRRGSSLLTRSRLAFVGLFLASAPVWWLFEFFNGFIQNWVYLGAEHYSQVRYFLQSSISFSTVAPAVFESAELIASFEFVRRFEGRRAVPASRPVMFGAVVFGLLGFAAMVLWPRYAFPFTWMSLFFILDPINYVLGWPSITAWVSRGDWRPVITLWAGALLCGFFWEMWNFYAWPKWTYHIPFVEFAHIFEMPLLGYGGYLPFGLELFAIYHFLRGLAGFAHIPYVRPWPDEVRAEIRDVWEARVKSEALDPKGFRNL